MKKLWSLIRIHETHGFWRLFIGRHYFTWIRKK